jgi:predicted enzyme related to lactoylglutathione lyase
MVSPITRIAFDCANAASLADFWVAVTGYAKVTASEEYAFVVHPDKVGPALMFNKVPEGKVVKNRVHVEVDTNDLEAEVSRIEGLGATRLAFHRSEEFNAAWMVMADPEGNEFCVVKIGL